MITNNYLPNKIEIRKKTPKTGEFFVQGNFLDTDEYEMLLLTSSKPGHAIISPGRKQHAGR